MSHKPIKKLYYSIGEVSKITSLKQYVLRYWETEFPQLRPSKNRAGNRIYRPEDIKLILQIKKLLYDEKYTIEGARRKLEAMRERGNGEERKLLLEIKRDLESILEILGDHRESGRGAAW